MAVRLLHTSWWVDFGYKGKRYRQRSPINTKAGAVAFEAELRHRLLLGQPLRPNAVEREVIPTFEDFSERWLETYVRSNNRWNTWRNTRTILRRHLRPVFGRQRINEIGPVHIEEFKKRQLSRGASRSSINQHLSVLRTCLNAACNWSVVERVTKVKLLPQPPGRLDYLRFDEIDRLLADRAEPRMNALVRLALRTGMRQGELLALRWDDIDFDDAMLTVQRTFSGRVLSPPKNNRIRHIPLSADALEALDGLPRQSDFVFSRVHGSPLLPGAQSDGLRRLALRAKVRPFATHVLRHTFATSALRNGADVRSVQSVLGHSKLEMTARYTHVSQGSLRNAVECAALAPPLARVNSASTGLYWHDPVRTVSAANSPHS